MVLGTEVESRLAEMSAGGGRDPGGAGGWSSPTPRRADAASEDASGGGAARVWMARAPTPDRTPRTSAILAYMVFFRAGGETAARNARAISRAEAWRRSGSRDSARANQASTALG